MPVYELNTSYRDASTGFIQESRNTLESAYLRVEHCLGQLHERDAWWRPHESMNAVGNIVLHLIGNVSQWLIAGVGGRPYTRNRPAEFAQRDPIPLDELRRQLNVTVDQADGVLAALRPDQLLEKRTIQGYQPTVLTAVYHAVSHFEGHAQEIIYITRQRLGAEYKFLYEITPARQASP